MDRALIQNYLNPMQPIPTTLKPQGSLVFPVSCLLCDLYGTLFISSSGELTQSENTDGCDGSNKAVLTNLLNHYDISYPPEDISNHLRHTIMKHHKKSIKKGNAFPEVKIEEIWKEVLKWEDEERIRRFAVEYEMLTNPVWPMPHLEDLLLRCLELSILPGIISNAQFYTPLLFQWFFEKDVIQIGFDPNLIFFSYQHQTAKPGQDLFNLALKRLHDLRISSDQVAFVGNDILNDMLPAHKAGFQTVLFAGDNRSLRLREDDPECRNFSPDVVITDLDQLKQLITKA